MPSISWGKVLNQTNFLIRGFRWGTLVFLVLIGFLIVSLLFSLVGTKARHFLVACWAKSVLWTLGIKVDAELSHLTPGALVVANHVSWVDIFVISSVLPVAFISKAEVRQWPIFGWLAAKNETVFLKRGSRGHAREIGQQITSLLAAKKYVAVFPEGTTTDGTRVQHFHAALIQPALAEGYPVLPLAISYWEPDGERSLAPRYDGDISLGQCMGAIIARKRLWAKLISTPALGLAGEDRRQVAAEARQAITLAAGLPLPST
jgi:1-acyl-sn-glycerol-3-phosphate acyltransferase